MTSLLSKFVLLALICACLTKNMKNKQYSDVDCLVKCRQERARRGDNGSIHTLCGVHHEDCCIDMNRELSYGECDSRLLGKYCREGTFAFAC